MMQNGVYSHYKKLTAMKRINQFYQGGKVDGSHTIPKLHWRPVEEAVQEARQAFNGWRRLTAEERNLYLNRLARLIEQQQDDIGEIICTVG